MIAYRPAGPLDRQFIVSGWSSSFKGSPSSGMIASERWADVMRVEINGIIDRPDCTTLVAYETNETSRLVDLYGFIAADPTVPLVFYVYTRGTSRRWGVARGLFGAVGIDPSRAFKFVCETEWCEELASKVPHAAWEPMLGRIQKHNLVPLERRRGRTRRRRAVPVTILRKNQ